MVAFRLRLEFVLGGAIRSEGFTQRGGRIGGLGERFFAKAVASLGEQGERLVREGQDPLARVGRIFGYRVHMVPNASASSGVWPAVTRASMSSPAWARSLPALE